MIQLNAIQYLLFFLFTFICNNCQVYITIPVIDLLILSTIIIHCSKMKPKHQELEWEVRAAQEQKVVLTVTTPTHDIGDHRYLAQLVYADSNYQVIPSIPKMVMSDPEEELIRAIPLSKNKLLDIALPFKLCDPDRGQLTYFGRYFLHNERLVGIRLSCSKEHNITYQGLSVYKWQQSRVINHPISHRLRKYYQSQHFHENSYMSEVPVGEFILHFLNLKIAPLFQSELKEREQLLQDYNRCGCDIISIISDVPRQSMNKLAPSLTYNQFKFKSPFQNKIRRMAQNHKKIIMYCGVKMVPLTEVYIAQGFIEQYCLLRAEAPVHLLDEGGTVSLVCNLQQVKKFKTLEYADQDSSYKAIREVIVKEGVRYSNKAQKIGAHRIIHVKPIELERSTESLTRDFFKKLCIWYLFKSLNEGQPFIIPLPLTIRTKVLLTQAKQMSQWSGLKLNELVRLYKTANNYIPTTEQQSLQVPIHTTIETLMKQFPFNKYYIYADDAFEIKHLTRLIETNEHIILCHLFLQKGGLAPSGVQMSQPARKIQEFLSHIIKLKNIDIKDCVMEAKSARWNLTRENLQQAFTRILKRKIHAQMSHDPLHYFILRASRDELSIALTEAEAKLSKIPGSLQIHLSSEKELQKPNHSFLVEQEMDDKQKQFWLKVRDSKRFKDKQSRIVVNECHKCMNRMDRNFGSKCRTCSNFVCYPCVEASHVQKLKTKNQYLVCIVCIKICNCPICLKETQQSMNFTKLKSQILLQQDLPSHLLMPLVQLYAAKVQGIYNQCSACMITENKILKIKVVCEKCNQQFCLNCVRKKYRQHLNFYEDWICYECQPLPSPKRAILMTPQMEEEIEPQPTKKHKPENGDKSDSGSFSAEIKNNTKPDRQLSRSVSPLKQNNKNKESFSKRDSNHDYDEKQKLNNQFQNTSSYDKDQYKPKELLHSTYKANDQKYHKEIADSVSKSPPRKNRNQQHSKQTFPSEKPNNQRKRSPSRSKPKAYKQRSQSPSPNRNKNKADNKKKRSASRSKSPPIKAAVNKQKNAEPSRSRSRSREKRLNESKPLWGVGKKKESTYNNKYEKKGQGRVNNQYGKQTHNNPKQESKGKYSGQVLQVRESAKDDLQQIDY